MHNLICIICPKGCHLQVDENNKVTGNSCKRGETYAINELTLPTRMVTSTIKVNNGESKRFEVMKESNKANVKAPIKVDDILIKNVLNLGVDIKATRTINEKE